MRTRQPIKKRVDFILLAASALVMMTLAASALVFVTLPTSGLVFYHLVANEQAPSTGERQELLRTALKGADRITVKEVEFDQQNTGKPFESRDIAKISDLISLLNFDDDESGFHCMCLGDAIVTFYKGDTKLAEIGHHHGRSLRWHDGNWEGDSLFTQEAAKAWREWFDAQGDPRFEKMHQQAVAEANREREIHDGFMRAFNKEAVAIFAASGQDGWSAFSAQESSEAGKTELSSSAKKLLALYPDRSELATALAKALGSLTITGAQEGSWSASSSREWLVLECAKTLDAEDFRDVLESDDEEALLGAARLFFFERLARLIPKAQRARYAAKLARVVLARDKCGNAKIAVRALGSFASPETFLLLEELAKGTIKTTEQRSVHKDEPSSQASACLVLAKFNANNAAELTRATERIVENDHIDHAALKIARSFSGEHGLLDKSIFEIDSYTVGFGALAALEREADKAALDAIIFGGTNHNWAAIREESVLTVERMTGQKWYQNRTNERAEWHVKAIREWWQTNRNSYVPPSTKPDNNSDQVNH